MSRSHEIDNPARTTTASRGHNAHPERRTNEGAENYAKVIYHLQGSGKEPVSTTAIAEQLGVTPASASAMLRRLADDGLVDYERYHGASLTEKGDRVALETIRHHRLLELFLVEVLDMPWDRVHEEAEVLEHHISEELEELIAAKLGEPALDPHGDPIPGADLSLPRERGVRLADMEVGASGTINRVSDSDPEMLRFLSDRGLGPGTKLRVTEAEPFGGGCRVESGGMEHTIGEELARRLRLVVD